MLLRPVEGRCGFLLLPLFQNVLKDEHPAHSKTPSLEFLQYCGVLTMRDGRFLAPCGLFNLWYKQKIETVSNGSNRVQEPTSLELPELVSPKEEKKLVITLHGIRTLAPWQAKLSDELGKAGFNTESLQYGRYGLFGFLRKSQRRKKIHWFREQYTQITKEYPDVIPSIIAHSFGTYIVANVLELYDGIRFNQVILCGSIIPEDYDWSQLFNNEQVKRQTCAE